MGAMQDEICLVFDNPFHNFSLPEFHRFSNGRWEIDVVLVRGFLSLDELNLGWVSHDYSFLCSSIYARA